MPLYAWSTEAEIESGWIVLSDAGACPSGYTRVSTLDDRFPRGASSAGGTGGAATHTHGQQSHTHTGGGHSHGIGSHTHTFSDTVAVNNNVVYNTTDEGRIVNPQSHTHTVSGTSAAKTGTTGSASPSWDTLAAGTTAAASNNPPYTDWLLCKKD